MVSAEEIERFINMLDEYVRTNEMCVNPSCETYECLDCYLCRIDFYNKVRDELRVCLS